MHTHFVKRRLALATMVVALAPLATFGQSGDDWPSRAITIVVASGAGSGVDIAARELAQKLSTALKQPVVVDNKPGGSGMLAGGILLLVNKDVPANNLKELVALVKANPERYSYGTWGNASSGHLTTEWLKKKAGLKMEHIPYKTTPQLVNDLASGVLQIGWADPGTPVPMIEANKIKGIAISGTNRVPRTRNVPTMGEQGYAFDSVGWFGVFGPANLPKTITDRLNTEINKVQASAEMAKRMETMNFEPPPVKTADEFKAIITADVKMWTSIAKESNITGE